MLARLLLTAGLLAAAGLAHASARVGQPAPELRGLDLNGKPVALADFKGRTVVVEWTNPNCPFVRKHYQADNIPALQREATGKGVVWLAVNSTRTDHADYVSPKGLSQWLTESKAAPKALIMDEKGVAGRAWGARATPHLFIVDPAGVVRYAGAIDSIASARTDDIPKATNYVRQGLGEALAGKAISTASTTPYGCSIKFAD